VATLFISAALNRKCRNCETFSPYCTSSLIFSDDWNWFVFIDDIFCTGFDCFAFHGELVTDTDTSLVVREVTKSDPCKEVIFLAVRVLFRPNTCCDSSAVFLGFSSPMPVVWLGTRKQSLSLSTSWAWRLRENYQYLCNVSSLILGQEATKA
jgi:hypothetical protein